MAITAENLGAKYNVTRNDVLLTPYLSPHFFPSSFFFALALAPLLSFYLTTRATLILTRPPTLTFHPQR